MSNLKMIVCSRNHFSYRLTKVMRLKIKNLKTNNIDVPLLTVVVFQLRNYVSCLSIMDSIQY